MSGVKLQCPECNGNNYYYTAHNDMGHCFNCGYTSFGDRPVIKQTRYEDITGIRQLYTALTEYYHSCIDDTARQYLHSRGLTDSDIQAYQLGYCPRSYTPLYNDDHAIAAGIVHKSGKPFLANRIIFPYWNSIYVTDMRGRSLDPHADIRYLSPFNGSFFRGADYPFLWSEDSVIVTEGELKAIAINKAGYAAIGAPGILSIRPKSNFDMICFDSDSNPNDVNRAILRIAKDKPDVKIITIPLASGERKMGADDYIEKYGVEAFRRLVSAALDVQTWKAIML